MVRAIVLVGGEGTRLRPLSRRTPKALVPVLNRPLLEHLLLHLRTHGIDVVTLALASHLSTAIRDALGDGRTLGVTLTYAYEEQPLGSGGAIASIARHWVEPFLVCNGDIITDLDVTAMISAHHQTRAALTISLHEVDDPSPYGVVALATDDRITRFVEKPAPADAPSHWINAGTWLFEPSLVRELDATRFSRVEDGLFPALATQPEQAGGIYGFRWGGYWMDVGTPEHYRQVNLDLVRGACGAREAHAPAIAAGVMRGDGTTIDAGAVVHGPAVIGAHCTIERAATIERSVLWNGVTVGAGAVVRDAVLASGVVVGEHAVVDHAVVADDVRIGAGAHIGPGARIEPGTTIARGEQVNA